MNVLRSQCGKKTCIRDGEKTIMVKPACKDATYRGIRQIKPKLFETISSPEDSEEIEIDITDDESVASEHWDIYGRNDGIFRWRW